MRRTSPPKAQAYSRSIGEETKKLGPNAAERGRHVKAWLASRLGPELAGELTSHFRTARHVEAFERLVDFTAEMRSRCEPAHRRRTWRAGCGRSASA